MKRYYAGIGSRSTPDHILSLMTEYAKHLETLGFTLRSGGASGADTAFEKGANKSDIYIPWIGYNGRSSIFVRPKPEHYELAASYHPNWAALTDGGRKLMIRNLWQILGNPNENQPKSEFVICWTPVNNSGPTGGTSQAIRHAIDLNIPVYNLYLSATLPY